MGVQVPSPAPPNTKANMSPAPSLPFTLHLFLLPDDVLDIPVTHLTRSWVSHCVRQIKRIGFRFNGVLRADRELDCVVGATLRRRNVVRRRPVTHTWDPTVGLMDIRSRLTESNWVMTVPVSWADAQLNAVARTIDLTPYCLISVRVDGPVLVQSLIAFNLQS